jgi:hypothetical protein
MNKIKILFTLFLLVSILAGVYFILSNKEGLEHIQQSTPDLQNQSSCPDLLIQKGAVLLLYNTSQPIVDGQNPLPFYTLDDYINYLEIQRNNGIRCPVLYLTQENNAQGQDVYRMRPSPFDLQGGLPTMVPTQNASPTHFINVSDASRMNPPYNSNNYPGFDPQGFYVGTYTNLDQIHNSTKQNVISDNPMDPNWAGTTYTQQMVDSGKYEGNAVSRPILFQPKNTTFNPIISGSMNGPVDIL